MKFWRSVAIEDRGALTEHSDRLSQRHQVTASALGSGEGIFGDSPGLGRERVRAASTECVVSHQ